MQTIKEVNIQSTRIGPRAYDVQVHSGDYNEVREFSNVNNAFCSHVVLRSFIEENPNTAIKLNTNVNALIQDIETLDSNPRTLTTYLRNVLAENNSTIISATYSAL